MTEEDAKEKWCPFARPAQVLPSDCGEVRGSRMMQGEVDTGSLCIGSACMAWRWGGEMPTPPANPERPAILLRDSPAHRKAVEAAEAWKVANRPGYCGLAGAAP